MMHGWSVFGVIAGLIGLLLVIGIIVALIVLAIWLWRRASEGTGVTTGQDGRSAHEILAARYARGEISRQEYLEMRRELDESADV